MGPGRGPLELLCNVPIISLPGWAVVAAELRINEKPCCTLAFTYSDTFGGGSGRGGPNRPGVCHRASHGRRVPGPPVRLIKHRSHWLAAMFCFQQMHILSRPP